jgi:hypothetical protein
MIRIAHVRSPTWKGSSGRRSSFLGESIVVITQS